MSRHALRRFAIGLFVHAGPLTPGTVVVAAARVSSRTPGVPQVEMDTAGAVAQTPFELSVSGPRATAQEFRGTPRSVVRFGRRPPEGEFHGRLRCHAGRHHAHRAAGPPGSIIQLIRADADTAAEFAAVDWNRHFRRVCLDPLRGRITLMPPSHPS